MDPAPSAETLEPLRFSESTAPGHSLTPASHSPSPQANSEVSALLGRIPSAVGYQPTLATDLGGLQERITTTKKGSITSVQAIYVPADDLTDPAPATTFAHLDATTVLSRSIAELGIYPAVDPLDSTSRILSPLTVGASLHWCWRCCSKARRFGSVALPCPCRAPLRLFAALSLPVSHYGRRTQLIFCEG